MSVWLRAAARGLSPRTEGVLARRAASHSAGTDRCSAIARARTKRALGRVIASLRTRYPALSERAARVLGQRHIPSAPADAAVRAATAAEPADAARPRTGSAAKGAAASAHLVDQVVEQMTRGLIGIELAIRSLPQGPRRRERVDHRALVVTEVVCRPSSSRPRGPTCSVDSAVLGDDDTSTLWGTVTAESDFPRRVGMLMYTVDDTTSLSNPIGVASPDMDEAAPKHTGAPSGGMSQLIQRG